MAELQLKSIRQTTLATRLLFLTAALITSCASLTEDSQLLGPSDVVLGYCYSSGTEVFDFYAYRLMGLDEGKKPSYKCEVVEVTNTTQAGEDFGSPAGFQNIIVDKDDVEVRVIEYYPPASKKPPQKFWYLVRNIRDSGWKIIAHTYLPDSNYPSHD